MRHRTASGRVRPDEQQDRRFPTMWRRIKDHGAKLGIHPYVGTVLGRLSLSGQLLDHQVEAGFRFAEIVGAYDRLCSGARRHTAASPAYERNFAGGPPSGSDESIARLERAARAARRRYERAMACVPNASAEALLIAACIEDREPGQARTHDLKTLLGVMAARLGIHDTGLAPAALPMTRSSGGARQQIR